VTLENATIILLVIEKNVVLKTQQLDQGFRKDATTGKVQQKTV